MFCDFSVGIMAKISTGGAVKKALFDFAYN